MIHSYILSALLKPSCAHESRIAVYFLKLCNKIFIVSSRLFRNSSFLSTLAKRIPWKSIFLFLFIVSLAIAPESNFRSSSTSLPEARSKAVNERQFGIPIISISNILLVLLILTVVKDLGKSRTKFYFRQIDLLLLFFFLTVEALVIQSAFFLASITWFLKLTYGLFIYFIFSRIDLKKSNIRIILISFCATLIVEGILSTAQFLSGSILGLPIESVNRLSTEEFTYKSGAISHFRSIGTFSHPNKLSAYLALLLPIILVLKIRAKNLQQNFFALFLIVFGVLSTSFSLSRIGLTSLFLGLLITLFLVRKLMYSNSEKVLHVSKQLLVIILLCMVVFFSTDLFSRRFLNLAWNGKGIEARLELLSESFYYIRLQPLGIGPGAFPFYLLNYSDIDRSIFLDPFTSVHNFYFLIMSEIGIIGFFFIIFEISRIFFYKIKVVALEQQLIAIGLFSSLLTFFLSGILELRTFTDRVGFLFFLLLGLLVNLLENHKTRERKL